MWMRQVGSSSSKMTPKVALMMPPPMRRTSTSVFTVGSAPNKQFITTEVVNWSIGDSCIRLVLPVGVSYSDDPEVVSELLRDIGLQDPGTLDDPEPSVSFNGFGDSSLDFQLRVYLAETDSLVPVRNRINIAIKKAFDERGISIPFPQRDVHVSMVDRTSPEGAAAPIPSPTETSNQPDSEGERP